MVTTSVSRLPVTSLFFTKSKTCENESEIFGQKATRTFGSFLIQEFGFVASEPEDNFKLQKNSIDMNTEMGFKNRAKKYR